MKCKALFGLRLLLGLVLFAIGSGQTGGFDVVVRQIETIGPKQWLKLMAGSIVSSASAGERVAHAFPDRGMPFASDETTGGNIA